MSDQNSYAYQESEMVVAPTNPGTGGPAGPLPSQYKFSPDELRVLGECNRESFYQRSVPLGTMFGLGTFLAVQNGRLSPNPRFGAFPKMSLAVMVGYFLGKLSYQQACAEKLMALPGSYIGQLLRERKEGKMGGPSPPAKQSSAMLGASAKDIYSDAGPGNSLDLDTDRPIFSGDDTYRPDSQGPNIPVPDAAPKGPGLSYDDLRRKNRGDYSETKKDPYKTELQPPTERVRTVRPPPPAATNQYGDVME